MKSFGKPLVAALALTILCAGAAQAGLSAKKGMLVSIPATLELKAPPAKVWAAVTSMEGFAALTGFKTTGGASFGKLGDSVAAQAWEDKGRLVVTEFVPQKELRVTFEPARGHYLCQKRIVLTPSAVGTRLEYWDRYTDDLPNADATARQVVAETEKMVAAFQKMVEK